MDRAWRRGLWLILLMGLLARGALWVGVLRSKVLDDPDRYLPLAKSLAAGRGFYQESWPTAYRPPLYPLILAPVVALFSGKIVVGVATLHLVLGAGTIWLTALTAHRWGLRNREQLIAAAIVACDPVLVAQSRMVMTETLAAFLVALSLAAVTIRGRLGLVAAGVVFGLGALCRPSTLAITVLSAIALLVLGQGSFRSRIRQSFLLSFACLLTLLPWAVRNALILGEPVWTTTHGGYTLFLANNPAYYDEVVNGPRGAVWTGEQQWRWWDSVNKAGRGLSEPESDRRMRDAALSVIRERPYDFARASLARLGRFWGIAPAGAVYPAWLRLVTAVWTVPLWIFMFLGLSSRHLRHWPYVVAPATVLAMTLVHTVYWTDMRMRAPAIPAIALIAASGAALIGGYTIDEIECAMSDKKRPKKI